MKRDTVPGEWQRDEWGRRFRMVGNIKEYEMMVTIDGHSIPESCVEEYNRQKAAALNKTAKTVDNGKMCPFKRARNGLSYGCKTNCPFWDDGCVFGSGSAASDTAGEFCPVCGICYKECALYDRGCTMIKTLKRRKGEEK